MGLYSRNKGKRGERLWASFCREQGYDVHRTAQYRGNTGAAGDVEGLPYIHCEVKYVQALNIAKAMEQSERDADAAGKDEFPIVASKRAKEPWLVTMRALDWLSMIGLYEELDNVHTAFKPQEKFSIRKELERAKELLYPKGDIVALRYDRGDFHLATMYAEEWFTLYREWEAGMDLKRRAEREEH